MVGKNRELGVGSRGSKSGVGAEEGLIIKKYVYSKKKKRNTYIQEICSQRQIGYSLKCSYKHR